LFARMCLQGFVCKDLFKRIHLQGFVCKNLFARMCLQGYVCKDLLAKMFSTGCRLQNIDLIFYKLFVFPPLTFYFNQL
jgi:hypothetical protein